MPTRPERPARVVLVVLTLFLGACHSWRTTTAPPYALISEERPAAVRITRANGSVVTLEQPTIVADSIVGMTESGMARAAPEDVRSLEVRRLSFPKTVALLAVQAAGLITILAFIVEVQPHYRGL